MQVGRLMQKGPKTYGTSKHGHCGESDAIDALTLPAGGLLVLDTSPLGGGKRTSPVCPSPAVLAQAGLRGTRRAPLGLCLCLDLTVLR